MGAPELPAGLLYELRAIRETHEKLQFGIPHMHESLEVMTQTVLRDHSLMAGAVRDRAATLRVQLENIDPTGALYEIRKKLWEVEQTSGQLAYIYWQYGQLYYKWLDELQKQLAAQATLVNSMLNDAVFDPLRVPVGEVYRNDPDASPYIPGSFQHFVGQGPLTTDAVEPRRAPEANALFSTGPTSLAGSPMCTISQRPATGRRQNRPRTPTINPALLQLRGPTEAPMHRRSANNA